MKSDFRLEKTETPPMTVFVIKYIEFIINDKIQDTPEKFLPNVTRTYLASQLYNYENQK